MSSIIWLHEDALSASHPAFASGAPALHIWDDAYLRAQDYSLKRLVFIYESLCQLPVTIERADTLTLLRESPATTILIPESPNPFIRQVAAALPPEKTVTWVPAVPFVTLKKPFTARRFFQYWQKAEKSALTPGGGAHA